MGRAPDVPVGDLPPVVFGLHATWAVNSATHMWGKRRFNTRDDSRNTWWIAIISFGEGWHNNHHAHPTSARHGLAWYEFDSSWLLIKVLKAFGLAKAIKVATVNSRAGRTRSGVDENQSPAQAGNSLLPSLPLR